MQRTGARRLDEELISEEVARESRLRQQLRSVRARTQALSKPLSAEDCALQSMPDASPVKWHLAHTTWFFETFLLSEGLPEYRCFDPAFRMLFNSYYVQIGPRHARPERGLVSRPDFAQVLAYRAHVDAALGRWIERTLSEDEMDLLELGIHHEQQHQELVLTDLKHLFSRNPLRPAYAPPMAVQSVAAPGRTVPPMRWQAYPGGLCSIGRAEPGFRFDNETPAHRVYLQPFRIASRPVTNAEYLAFMQDGGYDRPELWMSDGWDRRISEGWEAPLYWERDEGGWQRFTLRGMAEVVPHAPVSHVSWYEADAFARWRGARLPTEAEWECVAAQGPVEGNFAESEVFDPLPGAERSDRPAQCFGDVWEWTASAYRPYPGYRPAPGAVGEYNGKFMVNQFVLRGGSCATPASHVRATYRNFFPPHARWQFSGIRLAADA